MNRYNTKMQWIENSHGFSEFRVYWNHSVDLSLSMFSTTDLNVMYYTQSREHI